MEQYEEQQERMKRWYDRIKDIYYEKDRNLVMDFVYSFFQNCYHLKDYLINDQNYKKHNKDEIEEFVHKKSNHLKICADICNAIKHLKLKNKSTNPEFTDNLINVGYSEGNILHTTNNSPMIFKFELEVEHEGNKYDAFGLAKNAVDEWNSFI